MRLSNIMLQQGTLVITDYGLMGHVRRCVGMEFVEISVDRPDVETALISARDVRFVQLSGPSRTRETEGYGRIDRRGSVARESQHLDAVHDEEHHD